MPSAPPPSDNAILATRYQAGDRAAAEALLSANSGLCFRLARAALSRAGSLELEDLVQEARLGLLTAGRKFDPAQGVQFSTYAVPWIRQHITRAIENNAATIRIPARVAARGREDLPRATTSLDDHARVEEGEGETLADLLPAPLGWENALVDRLLVEDLLPCLAPAEQLVLMGLFGLGGQETRTLAAVGQELGVTRQRAQQLEVQALARLRAALRDQAAPSHG
jgi:RNA polymerase nonessential primary-like sigma factor